MAEVATGGLSVDTRLPLPIGLWSGMTFSEIGPGDNQLITSEATSASTGQGRSTSSKTVSEVEAAASQ